MTEKLAGELLQALGTGNASPQTAMNLVNEIGADRTKHYLAEMAKGGEHVNKIKGGLSTALVCCSDKLTEALAKHGIGTSRRTIMRAVKHSPELASALKRLLAGRASDEDVDLARAAILQAGSAAEAPPEPATPSEDQARPPVELPPPAQVRPPLRAALAVPPSPLPERAARQEPAAREGMHIYGGKAALSLEPCISRSGALALSVDAAQATGSRQYNWREKIIIQLTEKEMYLLYAVLRGFLARFEAKAHGSSNDKSFSIENQSSKFFVRVVQSGRPAVALPVEPADAALLASMLAKAVVGANPHLGSLAGVDALIQPMTTMLLAPQPRKVG